MTRSWVPHLTDDGSFTFFSEEFGETFHSKLGAKQEAFLKFSAATDLAQRAKCKQIRLLDVCYGLGYNTAAALETIWAVNPNCRVELYGLEQDESVPRAAIEPPLLNSWSHPVQAVLKALATDHQCVTPHLSAKLLIGDARHTLQQIRGFQADAIFFDPFSPRRCPQLWTVEFFQAVAGCLAASGKLATYSRSASVRSALRAAGLQIGTIPTEASHLPHEWSQGTVAGFDVQTLTPLSVMEQEHLQTRAAIPYQDPNLSDSAEVILERHQLQQQQSQCESTSSWRRRWGIR